MRANSTLNRNNKQLIGVIIIIAAIIGSLVASSGLMAGFDVGEEGARLYLNGVSYNGVKYLSEDALVTGLPGSDKFKWQDDEISVDVDGALRVATPGAAATKINPLETTAFDGWMPDVAFKFITNPQLIDLNGYPLSSGYTDLRISDGRDMYVYHYSVKLQIELNADILTADEIIEQGRKSAAEKLTFIRLIDGSVIGFQGLAEIGILKNIYALVSIDLPEVEGWTYGWTAGVDNQDIDFIWSVSGESFEKGDYGDYVKDNYPETISPAYSDYCVHFNLNEPIKPSHSNNDRIERVNVDGNIVGSIGLDSYNVPGVYFSYYTWYFYTQLVGEWNFMRPVFEYDLILKVTALDDVVISNDTTTTTTTGPVLPPFPGFDDLVIPEIPQEILISGGIGLGLIVVVMWYRRRSEYGY